MTFAQLLHVGCPPQRAILYVFPLLDKDDCKATTAEWMASPLVLQAVEQLNGGAWMHLAPEKRYELSLAKHISEMAFYLYANNFNDIEHKEGLEKMKQARDVLRAELKGGADDGDPSMAFARFAMELLKDKAEKQAESKSPLPPDLRKPKRPMPANLASVIIPGAES